MERESEGRGRDGSVKAAREIYGERSFNGSSPSLMKTQMDFPESSSRARELHRARRDINGYKDGRRVAEMVKSQAEHELYYAKKTEKDLSSLIEESSSKSKTQWRDFQKLTRSGRREEAGNNESYRYSEVMRELEIVKRELSKLKLEMATVMEDKVRAEKEFETSSLKMWSNSSSIEILRKQIEEANEEQVLTELARIEALKEYTEIEAQREKEANGFSFAMEETKKRMNDVLEELDKSKEVKNRLVVTLSDINVLQNELKHVKDQVERKVDNDSFRKSHDSSERGVELLALPLLKSVMEELEEAKKELDSIKEEGFQFMASMDVIRNEQKHVREETARIKKTEEMVNSKVQNMNSKLLRAKSKLAAVSAAEEKAKSIATNLSLTLDQLKAEAEAAKKEKALVVEETAAIKAEIQKAESEIDVVEERLQAAMNELDAVKSSEASAFEKLKSLIDKTVQARAASASQHSSTIIISKFEYEYLKGHAGGAEEIADKKVAAAQAWIEALKASEKEIVKKTEMTLRESGQTRVEEENNVYRTERSLSAKRRVEGEMQNWRQKRERNSEAENKHARISRKSTKSSEKITPTRQGKFRKSASPATRVTPTYFTIKKKRKMMPSLAKIFSGKKGKL